VKIKDKRISGLRYFSLGQFSAYLFLFLFVLVHTPFLFKEQIINVLVIILFITMSLWYINGMREQSRIVNWWGEKGKDLYWEKHKQGFKFHSQKGWIKYEKNSWDNSNHEDDILPGSNREFMKRDLYYLYLLEKEENKNVKSLL
tara:strand:+ start:95 stop:526 length:432 start_codon:yes stop_codon:yes gene_type:complete